MASDLDELQSFIIERILDFDSTIDVSAGSDVDNAIVQPLLSRLGPDVFETPILEFLVRRAQTEFPDLVIQKGEPIYDLIFNFARLAVNPFRRQINLVRNNQSIADPSLLTETEADRLMANYFTSRQEGGFAVGTARLFFNQARFASVVPTQAVFTGDGLRYFPIENQSITAEQMIFNQSGSLFFFDIVVRAEEQGEEYNIQPDTLIGIEDFPAVVRVQNRTRFVDGITRETTEEFFARVEQSLAERSLVVPRGIRARLFEVFDTIQSIGVTGFGDIEMNRDLVTGAPDGVYAFAILNSSAATSRVTLTAGTNFTSGIPGQDNFVSAGVTVGDTVSYLDPTSGSIEDFTVQEVVSAVELLLSPVPPTVTGGSFWFKSKDRGQLFISDIPGGILEPTTPQGEITVNNNQVHIGGKTDIFIRAGQPQEATISVGAVRDANPLQLGTDLESFGANTNEFVQVFEEPNQRATTDAAFAAPGDTTAQILIPVWRTSDDTTPWEPSDQDIGRYLELFGPVGAGNINFGAFEITAVGGLETVSGALYKRVTISLLNQWTGANDGSVADFAGVESMPFRVLESVSVASRVRDRSLPQVDFNGSGQGLGSEIGDSVVIETGNDAGVYTIRRILSSIGTDDTLILDRDLGTTTSPTGLGDGSGLRYRLDDEIQLDLVNPRNTKIPISPIFPGGDLSTVANSNVMTSSTTNFLLAGVEVGDVLEIAEGNAAGTYTINDVQANQVTTDVDAPATTFNQTFSVYTAFTGIERPMVRVSEIELLDATNQPTGITVPYGDIIDVRALGAFSNRAQGSLLESFQGEVIAGSPLVTLQDTSVDFVARGVTVGDRLEVYDGLNIGEYEIATVAANQITVVGLAAGDKDFATVDVDIHYNIGLTSSGIARLYFLDPTSVEIDTGISGGRLQSEDTSTPFGFRFSTDDGFVILPEAGATSTDTNDLRVVRTYSIGGGQFESVVELTGTGRDVFNLELQVGDLMEVQEEIELVDSTGTRLIEASGPGIFGTFAGLRTIAGSALVSVPANSSIDFAQMGDLAGQTLRILSGPDAGTYTIRRRVDSKTLELNSILVATTENIIGRESATTRDCAITQVGSDYFLVDATDVGQLPAVGDYITIFESTNPALEGTYEVAARDIPNNRVRLNGISVTSGLDTFTWVATGVNTLSSTIEQPFRIYNTTPTIHRIKEVASVGPELTGLQSGTIAGVPPLTTLTGVAGDFAGVARGDRLEVVSGPNEGVYPIVAATTSSVTVSSSFPFAGAEVGTQYRVRGGLHGSRRMLTLEGFQGSDGNLVPGLNQPYQIRRPGVIRVPSTVMETQVENGLFYVDVAIESLGPGDNRNLNRLERLTVTRGVRTDGYTYTVQNPNLTFSTFEEVTLNFDRRVLPVGNSDLPENRTEIGGRNLQITYENSPTVRTVNSFVRGDADRVLVADPIARHFLPSFVFVTFTYQGGSSVNVVGPEIETFINSLGALDELEVSDLEAFLTRRGATSIRHPITLVTVTHDLDRNLIVERSEDKVGGTEVPFNGTGRISSYFTTLGEGLVLVRQ